MDKSKHIAETLQDLKLGLDSRGIEFLLTRYDENAIETVDDIDILVSQKDFTKVIEIMKSRDYEISSHDYALGGRLPGVQVNLTKEGRIKIDLHWDFTWRRSRYMDLEFIWQQSETRKIAGVQVQTPKLESDLFLILTNIIFEKTYSTKTDWIFLNKRWKTVVERAGVQQQVEKYGWSKSFTKFKKSFMAINSNSQFPVFIPLQIVLYSFYEKFKKEKKIDIVSFLYYVFFRTRFALEGVLPY